MEKTKKRKVSSEAFNKSFTQFLDARSSTQKKQKIGKTLNKTADNITRKQRKLRVLSCAIMLIDTMSRGAWYTVNAIMYSNDCYWIKALMIYTRASIKRLIRNGTARNVDQALDIIEARQVLDIELAGNNQSSIIGQDPLARDIARIDRINKGGEDAYNSIMATPADVQYHYRHRNDTRTQYPYFWLDRVHKDIDTFRRVRNTDIHKPSKRTTYKQYGRALGSAMITYDAQQAELDPAVCYDRDRITAIYDRADSVLPAFFSDYISRLSPTRQTTLRRIIKADVSPDELYSLSARQGKLGDDVAKLAWGAYRLYSGFPHRDSIDPIQWIGLMRKYVDTPIVPSEYTPSLPIVSHTSDSYISLYNGI